MHNRDKTQKLIERIIRSVIEHTDHLRVTNEHIPGLTQWYIKVKGEDQGKVRGRKASHIIAIQYIVGEIGAKHDEIQRVKLLESDERVTNHRSPLVLAEQYNPMDAHELLHDLLMAILDQPFRIDPRAVAGPTPASYDFHVTTTSLDDQATMLEPYETDQTGMTLIAALGTLFRAYASREGVTFTISIDSKP